MVFARLRRFVDWDLRHSNGVNMGGYSLFISILIAVLPLPFLEHPVRGRGLIVAAVFGAAAALWFSFVLWRAWCLLREEAAKADRAYDQRGKYRLPTEYARTESAAKAAQRRASRQVRNDEDAGAR